MPADVSTVEIIRRRMVANLEWPAPDVTETSEIADTLSGPRPKLTVRLKYFLKDRVKRAPRFGWALLVAAKILLLPLRRLKKTCDWVSFRVARVDQMTHRLQKFLRRATAKGRV